MNRKSTPSYLPHKATGRARAVWTDDAGQRHDRLLPGTFDSPESRMAFAQLQLEVAASPLRSPETKSKVFSINELMLAFIEHAKQHYRRADGSNTDEFSEFKRVSKFVRRFFGDLPAVEFGPSRLKVVRERCIAEGWSRGFINQRIGKIKRVFKWAVSEEMVPSSTYQALTTVTGLQRGRTKARETEPVCPVDNKTVDATIPHLNRHVRGLVGFQRLTGCRPGEACSIRRCDIDMTESVWMYRPHHHKTIHRGKSRIIPIGPKAQELLKEFFASSRDAYLFSPAAAMKELGEERSVKRTTPKYPSHMKRNAAKRKTLPKRSPSDKYTRGSYEQAIDRACDKAFPPPGDLAQRLDETAAAWKARLTTWQHEELKAWQKAHRWSPNQLRHSHATRVRKEFGLEAAGAALGHTKMSATEIYAERDAQLAASVASKIG